MQREIQVDLRETGVAGGEIRAPSPVSFLNVGNRDLPDLAEYGPYHTLITRLLRDIGAGGGVILDVRAVAFAPAMHCAVECIRTWRRRGVVHSPTSSPPHSHQDRESLRIRATRRLT
jgi:hypothetical protein